jgi:L-lactate dehydrogenase complex protein LldG
MSSRDKILTAVAANKPALVALPEIHLSGEKDRKIVLQQFIDTLHSLSVKTIRLESVTTIEDALITAIDEGGYVVNTMPESGVVNEEINAGNNAVFLEKVEKAFIRGSIGVAENGAIWVPETNMINRLLPFICQHLILVVETDKIVATMQEAYRAIKIDEEGFGVFIAGPSKTADIEQSLVIGAHGARSLLVYLIDKPI